MGILEKTKIKTAKRGGKIGEGYKRWTNTKKGPLQFALFLFF